MLATHDYVMNIVSVVNILGWITFDEEYISGQTYL